MTPKEALAIVEKLLAQCEDGRERRELLTDLFTDAELVDVAERWEIVRRPSRRTSAANDPARGGGHHQSRHSRVQRIERSGRASAEPTIAFLARSRRNDLINVLMNQYKRTHANTSSELSLARLVSSSLHVSALRSGRRSAYAHGRCADRGRGARRVRQPPRRRETDGPGDALGTTGRLTPDNRTARARTASPWLSRRRRLYDRAALEERLAGNVDGETVSRRLPEPLPAAGPPVARRSGEALRSLG